MSNEILTYTDSCRIGVAHYEISGNVIRCWGKYYFGYSFDATYSLSDLSDKPQFTEMRTHGFQLYLNLFAIGLIGSLISWEFHESDFGLKVFYVLCFATLICAVVLAWSFPKDRYRHFVLKNYTAVISVRVCEKSKSFIELLEQKIKDSQGSELS
jgi:hypothetical protein